MGRTFALPGKDHPNEYPNDRCGEIGIESEVCCQLCGEGQHPLAKRNVRERPIDQKGGPFAHHAASAGWAAPRLAGEGYDAILLAAVALQAPETPREIRAIPHCPKLPKDEKRDPLVSVGLLDLLDERLQMVSKQLPEHLRRRADAERDRQLCYRLHLLPDLH